MKISNLHKLPYIPRPDLEEKLKSFLISHLSPRPSTTKALLLSGKEGVGKRTLLTKVFQQERQLHKYASFTLDMQKPALHELAEQHQELLKKVFDSAAEIATAASSFLVTMFLIILRIFLKDLIFAKKIPKTFKTLKEIEDMIFSLTEKQPTILQIENFNGDDLEHARSLAHLVNEAYLRKSAFVIAIIAHEKYVDESNPSKNIRRFLRSGDHLYSLAVTPLTQEACVSSLTAHGLSSVWAKSLYQFSAGHPALMNSLWQLLQEKGIIHQAGKNRWEASDDPQYIITADFVRRSLRGLIDQRSLQLPAPFDSYLQDSLLMAAAMGETFLPQAVAEAVLPSERQHTAAEIEAWEDGWYEFLEDESEVSSPLASPVLENGQSKTLTGTNNRRFFVYAFDEQKWKYLLSHTARQMCDPTACNRPFYQSLVQLDEWLLAYFKENWQLVLPYRIAVNRALWRIGLAVSLEKQQRLHNLLIELPIKIDEERQLVARGEAAGTLYQLLLWYHEVLENLGNYPEALEIIQEAYGLVIQHKVKLKELEFAILLNLLGFYYYNNGRYTEAEPLYRRSLEICKQQLGPNHPKFAIILNNLAELLQAQGRYTEAEPLVHRSLEICKQQLGPNHPDVALILNNLAKLLRAQGRYTEAEPLYRRSLEICEQQLGPNHPDVAFILNNLAGFLCAQGKYTEAELLFRRSLEIYEKSLGAEHPDTQIVRRNLVLLVEKKQGR